MGVRVGLGIDVPDHGFVSAPVARVHVLPAGDHHAREPSAQLGGLCVVGQHHRHAAGARDPPGEVGEEAVGEPMSVAGMGTLDQAHPEAPAGEADQGLAVVVFRRALPGHEGSASVVAVMAAILPSWSLSID
ncbi:hypothetical protein MTP03_33680 [Tsukamurella sp. PLM1]|nr:hypothetical protein MTP03_33680 [Tsukamurella sp. PLM1]